MRKRSNKNLSCVHDHKKNKNLLFAIFNNKYWFWIGSKLPHYKKWPVKVKLLLKENVKFKTLLSSYMSVNYPTDSHYNTIYWNGFFSYFYM